MRRNIIVWPFALLLAAHCAWADQQKSEATKSAPVSPSRLLARLWEQPGSFDQVRLVELLGDTLYIAGTPKHLEARNTADGMLRWRHIGKLPVDSRPIERNDTLYLVEGGRFVTLSRTNGDELSRKRTRLGVITPIYPGENSWIIGASDNRLYGLAPGAVHKDWHASLDDHILSSTWGGGDLVYFLTASGTLYAASLSTRGVAWRHEFKKPGCSPIALAGETIYVGNEDYRLYALDAVNGTMKWKVLLSGPATGVPVVAGGRVYLADANDVLNAVDPVARSVIWTLNGGYRVLTTTPQHVIFLRKKGDTDWIAVADAETGEVKTEASAVRHKFFAAAPEGGVFYAVASNGDVLAMADRQTAEQQRESSD